MAGTKKSDTPSHLDRMVTFEVKTTKPLPVGQQVFISGNISALGSWQPDGFPLTRLNDNVWSGYAVIEPVIPVEFKVTRGTWHTEECDADGKIREENHTLDDEGSITFKHTVIRWLDRA